MYICYIDESGDSGTLQLSDPFSNPLFVIVGLIVNHNRLIPLTHDFINIKRRFFPNHFNETNRVLDGILVEIKGNDLRKNLRENNRRRFQQSVGFIDNCLDLLRQHGVQLLGKALIKSPDSPNSDAAFYGSSIMHFCQHFNMFLEQRQEQGVVVADSRKAGQNKNTTHTVFTQRHQFRGNSYPRIIEMPTYGHSNNFAMLQLADIVCSAVVFPMVIDAFGAHLLNSKNIHASSRYTTIRGRYKELIKKMQFMYQDASDYWVGGMLVSDRTNLKRKTSQLFS